MADTKITALTALTAADPANDVLPIVDVSDTTMAASGTTKKISVNNILGCSGTATLASATITGDLTVATNTLKTTSGNVGIGTVTPDIFSRFYTRTIGFNSSGSTVMQINGSSYSGIDLGAGGTRTFGIASSATDVSLTTLTNIPIVFGINGSEAMRLNSTGLGVGAVPSAYKLHVAGTGYFSSILTLGGASRISAEGSNALNLNTNSADRLTIDSSGNVGIGVTPSAGKGCLQLSSGINFPATQVASADANTLDDYEEGTWTPTFTFATPGTLAVTYSVRTGNYTKVGNLVTARYAITINPSGFVKGTASGGLQITGLPFAVSGTGTQYVDLAASLTDQTSGSLVFSYPAASIIYFEQTQVSGIRVIRSSTGVDASNFAATNTGFISLNVVLTYTV